ncbi:FAD linked oxidase, N-terminal [Dillenia turbinata]|uniref:FAD linked oxidase, N-terminal n=1 Tax=Dillenia turbinata TaxID=194707 RepID=A0AAN8V5P3_9MAGN
MNSERKSFKKCHKEHEENVQKAVKRLKERNLSRDGLVDLSAFGNIREIDKERMIAKVEPLVNMEQITCVTVPMNLALAVVAVLDDLTVGGLINGNGIEDGCVVRATKDNEFSDLFYAIPWSQGTLGLLVSAEIKLIPIKEYMKLTYKPVVGNLKDLAQADTESFAPRDGDQDNPEKVPDFVEAMIYGPTEAECMKGVYVSKEEAKRRGTRLIVLDGGSSPGKLILPFADQFWFRLLFGWLMPPKVSLLKFTQGEAIRNYYHEMHVIQDVLVPLYKLLPYNFA